MEMNDKASGWLPDLERHGKPHYRAIAEAIAEDVREGRLKVADRLPPQRELAEHLGLNFTTIARGYAEAQRRGLVESHVGQGTFVAGQARSPQIVSRPSIVDLTMNVAPEPEDAALIDRMQAGLMTVAADMPTLMRYQAFGGTYIQREAAAQFLRQRALIVEPERLLICPGTHVAFMAILQTLTQPGDTILCEALTYPGIKAIAGRLGLKLVGIPIDQEGIDPEEMGRLCQQHGAKILYLNPTLLNPTTATLSLERRTRIVEIARSNQLVILEDDAYGALLESPVPAFMTLAPDITYHVASLSKCVGAGLRIAYLSAPDQRRLWPIAGLLRTMCVMASPMTTALSTLWIQDGTASAVVASLRNEVKLRQAIAQDLLSRFDCQTHPEAFHIWLKLPEPWQRSAFAARMRASDISIVVSDAFTVLGTPPEAVRISLGGVLSRTEVRTALDYMSHVLDYETDGGSAFA